MVSTRKFNASVLLSVLCLFFACTCRGQDCPELLKILPAGGGACIDYSEPYVYYAIGQFLYILDVSVPESPVEMSRYVLPGRAAVDMVYHKGNVYVLIEEIPFIGQDGGVHVVNVSDPHHPVKISVIDLYYGGYGIDVYQDYLCAADGLYGLKVFDISMPHDPILVGSWRKNDLEVIRVEVHGRYAHIACDVIEGYILDMESPSHPVEVGQYDHINDRNCRISVTDNYSFVCSNDLWIYDISEITSPELIAFYETPGHAFDAQLSGYHLFVLDYYGGLRILDLSDPANPCEVGSLTNIGGVINANINDDHMYLASLKGMYTINISTPSRPELIGHFVTYRGSQYVLVRDNLLYSMYSQLDIYDISDPMHPVYLGYAPVGMDGSVFTVENNYAYVIDGVVHIVDVTNPTDPIVISTYDTPGLARNVTVRGDYAYISDGYEGLQILDISDPFHPQGVGEYKEIICRGNMELKDNYLYIASNFAPPDNIMVLDVSDLSCPVRVSSYSTPGWAKDITIVDDLAFISDGEEGLIVIDISDPFHLSEVSTLSVGEMGNAWQSKVRDNLWFIAAGYVGLMVVDISDPSNPRLIGEYDSPYYAYSLDVSENLVVLADGVSGIDIIDISECRSRSHDRPLLRPQ